MNTDRKKIDVNRLPKFGEAEETFAAKLLIKIGVKNKDGETKRIGQARLRIAENRGTSEDYEILGMELPRDLPEK